jgi:hypothetical protein
MRLLRVVKVDLSFGRCGLVCTHRPWRRDLSGVLWALWHAPLLLTKGEAESTHPVVQNQRRTRVR